MDLSSLTFGSVGNAVTAIQTGINQAVVAPLSAFGFGGFVFDIEGDSNTVMSSDIPDHFLEDATTVQEHWAVKPLIVTLKNYQGEVQDNGGTSNNNSVLQTVIQKLTTLNSFLPVLSNAAQQFQGVLNTPTTLGNLQNIVNPAADLYALVKNLTQNKTRQDQAYFYFKALWQQKIPIGIQTAHEFLTNMAILNVVADQPEPTKYMSNFTIILKQLRFAQTINISGQFTQNSSNPTAVLPSSAADFQGPLASQAQSVVQQGITSGAAPTDAEEGVLDGGSNNFLSIAPGGSL